MKRLIQQHFEPLKMHMQTPSIELRVNDDLSSNVSYWCGKLQQKTGKLENKEGNPLVD